MSLVPDSTGIGKEPFIRTMKVTMTIANGDCNECIYIPRYIYADRELRTHSEDSDNGHKSQFWASELLVRVSQEAEIHET